MRTAIAPRELPGNQFNWFRNCRYPRSNNTFALRRDWLVNRRFQHRPNIDAVLFFVNEIYPLVSEHLRDAKSTSSAKGAAGNRCGWQTRE